MRRKKGSYTATLKRTKPALAKSYDDDDDDDDNDDNDNNNDNDNNDNDDDDGDDDDNNNDNNECISRTPFHVKHGQLR